MRSLLAVPATNARFLEKAAGSAEGRGAVKTKDGKMIDLVHIKIARRVLERAERIDNRR